MDVYWEFTALKSRQITVKMITDRAGYNRGTFSLIFDIEDLHNQIEDELLPLKKTLKIKRGLKAAAR